MTEKLEATRPMRAADAAAVLAVQHAAYAPALHEDWACLGAKLALYPAGCWVLEQEGGIAAYLFSHPWTLGLAVPLHAQALRLPARPDCLYLHDLALHPNWRGRGLARALIGAARRHALGRGLRCLGLVAVQDSRAFWERQGFGWLGAAPAAYGPSAGLMRAELHEA